MNQKTMLMMATMLAIATPEEQLIDELIAELQEYKLLKMSWNETKVGERPELPIRSITMIVLKGENEGKSMLDSMRSMDSKLDSFESMQEFDALKKDITSQ